MKAGASSRAETAKSWLWAGVAGALFGWAYLSHGGFAWLGTLALGMAITGLSSPAWRREVIGGLGLLGLVTGLHGWGFVHQGVAIYVSQALYLGLSGVLVGWLVTFRSSGPEVSTLRLALAWTAVEALHQAGPVGYPLFLGGTQSHLFTRSALGVVGVFGVSGLIVAIGPAAVRAVRRRGREGSAGTLAGWAGLSVLVGLLGLWQPGLREAGPAFSAVLVQGGVPTSLYAASEASVAAKREIEDRYFALGERALSSRPDLVVFPESVLYRSLIIREGQSSEPLFRPLPPEERAEVSPWVITGAYVEVLEASDGDERLRTYNAALLLRGDDPYRVVQQVDKRVLAPLAEGALASGGGDGVLRPGERGVGVLICFESMYPRLARELAERAGVLAVLTNDAGFERSRIARVHARQGMARAVETGRPLLRAAQAGITLTVDWRGHVWGTLGLFEVGTLEAQIQPMRGWTWFTAGGYLVGPLSGAALLLLLLSARWRARRSRRARPSTSAKRMA